MNNQRRKELNKAIGLMQEALAIIETARDEEGDFFENMPESLQDTERGQKAEETYGNLEEACGYLQDVISSIENAVES
jgi:hypothetical protein